jgi:hypothetical protein
MRVGFRFLLTKGHQTNAGFYETDYKKPDSRPAFIVSCIAETGAARKTLALIWPPSLERSPSVFRGVTNDHAKIEVITLRCGPGIERQTRMSSGRCGPFESFPFEHLLCGVPAKVRESGTLHVRLMTFT